jgi:large subunit ribosomal protein L47
MRGIKHALTERFYAWEDATKLSENDPEVNLSGEGPAFTPSDYLEDADAAAAEEGKEAVEAAEETAAKAEEPATAAASDPATIPASKPQAEAPRL